MPNSLTARNMELTPSIREYVEGKVDRLRKIFENIQKIEVILSSDKLKRGEADLIVEATQGTLKCAAKDANTLAAFDVAMEKMERQLQRHKAKIVGNKKHPRENPRRLLAEGGAMAANELPSVELPFEDIPSPQPVRPQEMSEREAVDRFVQSNYEVLIYLDQKSRRPSVLYRDQDGENRLLEIV